MLQHIKKHIALTTIIAMIISLLSFVSVFAEEVLPVNIDIGFEGTAEKNGVFSGKIIKPYISINMENSVAVTADGLRFIQFYFKFDPNKLEILDPETLEPIEFDENRNPLHGKFYKVGELGQASNFTFVMNTDMRTITLNYGGLTKDANIHESGKFASFAFRVKDDISVNNSDYVDFEIEPDLITCVNDDAIIEPVIEKKTVKINPPYTLGYMGDLKQNSNLELTVTEFIDDNSEYPLTLTISKGDEVFHNVDIPVNKTFYTDVINLDENVYAPGLYTFELVYRNTNLIKYLNIVEKDEPKPVKPTEPDNTDKDNTNTDDTNTDDNSKDDNGKDDTQKPSVGGVGTSTGLPIKPNDIENNDKPADVKPSVAYPSDISGHWANNSIKYVYDHSLMNGYADGTFGPENPITRAEFSTVMARLLGLTENVDAADNFADCTNHWAKGYIGALANAGVVGGVADGEFAPDDNITREQIAVILSRAFKLSEISEEKYNDDSNISSWAYDDVYKVNAAGYMKGDTDNNFDPSASATRAEVATIIYRLHQK